MKFKRCALILFVLLSSILLCTSCLSLLLEEGDGPKETTMVLEFAPDTSDANIVNLPSISETDVSVTVQNSSDEIVAEKFVKAGSRTRIMLSVPKDEYLKVNVSFSGAKGVWTGETKRALSRYSTVIVKMKKVSGKASAYKPTSRRKPTPKVVRKPKPKPAKPKPAKPQTIKPKPAKPQTIKPEPIKPQTDEEINVEPIYYSAIDKNSYRFNGAKNDLKNDRFEFFNKYAKKHKQVDGKTKKIYLKKTVFCRDNDANLYIQSDYETLKCYNNKGKLTKTMELYGDLQDVTCDPTTNEVYAIVNRDGPAGEEGVNYGYALCKIGEDFKFETICVDYAAGITSEYYDKRPSMLTAYNGMLVCSYDNDPIWKDLYYVDLSSSQPKFTRVEFPESYHYAGADCPESIINDVFMDDKYIYLLTTFDNWGENPADEGKLIVYDYKVIGSKGNRKIKVDLEIFNMKVYGGYAWGAAEDGYYKNNFAVPIQFVGYQNGKLYIADDGIEKKDVNNKYENVRNINRLATFDIENKKLSFKELSGVTWLEQMK